MADDTTDTGTVQTGVDATMGRGLRLLGDTLIAPGTSLLLDGDVASGALHVAAGLAARAALGPVGWLLVAANAYSQSVSGRSIVSHALSSTRTG